MGAFVAINLRYIDVMLCMMAKCLLSFFLLHSPSQFVPTIAVLKTWVVLWTWKELWSRIWSAKSRVQKTESLLFKKRRLKFISQWISSKIKRLRTVYTFLKIPAIVVSSTSTTLRSYYTLVTFSLNGNFGNTGWLLPSKPPFLLLEHVQKSAPGVHRVVGDTKHTSVNQKVIHY